jgi:hypothetical protein
MDDDSVGMPDVPDFVRKTFRVSAKRPSTRSQRADGEGGGGGGGGWGVAF